MYMSSTLYWQSRGKGLAHAYKDIIYGTTKEDDRSGDEIAADVIAKLGLKVKEDTHGST